MYEQAQRYAEELEQEVAERKRAEEALRQSEERMKLALEGTEQGLWDWDVVTGAITFDDNWPSVLGYTPGEMAFDFAWWERSIHPDSAPVFEAALNDYLEGREKYYELEYQIKNKSGEWRWIWARGICVAYGEQGEPLRMLGTHRDITERKRAEEELKNSRERLRNLSAYLQSAREEERTSIAREIHDELGQVLTALIIDLSWLENRLPREQKLLLEKIESMLKFIDMAIQTVQRISSELRPGILDDFGITAAIEWQTEEFQNRTGIKCEVTLEPEDIILDKACSTTIFRIFQESQHSRIPWNGSRLCGFHRWGWREVFLPGHEFW